MPIILNVIIGVPQMLSNIQMILICVGVSWNALTFLAGFVADMNLTWRRRMSFPR